MTKHFDPPKRGIVSVRADGTDPKAIAEQLQKTWAEFQASHDKQLEEIKAGMEDVVTSEKVDKINAEVGNLQKALDEQVKRIEAMNLGTGGKDAPSAEKIEHAKAFDRFFRKGVEGELSDLQVKAGLSSDSDPDGGYVVPHEMEQAIDRVVTTISAMRRIAHVVPTTAATYKKLVTTSGASSGWVGEKESRSETNTPKLSALEFPMKEIYANPAATQNVLDDSATNISEWLASEVEIEFAEQEGDAFINGNGVSEPKGLLSYTKVANASYAWGKVGFVQTGVAGDWPASNPDDSLIDLLHALKQQYRQNARFMMNDTTAAAVRKIRDADGRSLWEPSTQAGMPTSLLGKPVETDDNMPDIADNAYPIAFGDFQRAYLIVDRQGIRVLRDPFTNKPYVHFYTTKRVGGGIQNFEAVKLLKFAD